MQPHTPNTFDIITSTGRAYITVWNERKYLATLLIAPILIKLACYTAALSLGYADNMLRLSLILIPASFAEGWMLSHFARFLILGQRWPYQTTGDDEADFKMLDERMRGILPGTVSYVLINLIVAGVLALTAHFALPSMDGPISPEDLPPGAPVILLSMMAVLILCFRLLWVHIPLAVGGSANAFVATFGGAKNLAALFGLWLLCSIPVFVAMQFLGAFVVVLTGGTESAVADYVLVILNVIADTFKNLICVGGVIYAWRELTVGKPI